MVANPDRTPFWGYFRIAGQPPGTPESAFWAVDSRFRDYAFLEILAPEFLPHQSRNNKIPTSFQGCIDWGQDQEVVGSPSTLPVLFPLEL